jgi:hypothetical protein
MELLYHYCSTEAFHAIVGSQCLWLSSLPLSNDTMEGKLVAGAIESLAKRDGLEQKTVASIQRQIGMLEDSIHGLGFCLSYRGTF